jgi:RND family efflux transporter MFP subunit
MSSARQSAQRWALLALLTIMLVLVASLYFFSPSAAEKPPGAQMLALPTETIQYREVAVPVYSRGVARARQSIPLVSEVGGRVTGVSGQFADGAFVDTETVLVQLEEEPFKLDIARHRNKVKAAELHRVETRANATVALKNNKHSSAFARFEPQLAEAESRVEAARASLRGAERKLEQASITAPFPGRLDQVAVQTGQYIQPGTRLAVLSTPEQVEVRLPVRDDWLGLLGFPLDARAETPDVSVTLTGRFAGREGRWRGQVVRREGGLNSNQMVFLVVHVRSHGDSRLPLEPGVFVEAELTGKPRRHVAVLPRAAMAGDGHVWVLDDHQRLKRQKVEIIHRDNRHLYISGGLREKAEVVRAAGLRLLEGTPVKPLGPVANTAWTPDTGPVAPGGGHAAQY